MIRNISFLICLLYAAGIFSSCTNRSDNGTNAEKDKLIDSLKNVIAQQEAPTLAEAEDFYSMQFLSTLNTLSEIRANRSNQLADRIESSLPDYLAHISTFNSSTMKTASFYIAGEYYKEVKKTPPAELSEHFEMAVKVPRVLSDSCYEEIKCNGGKGCVPWPTSLRAVDITKPNVMGWRYIVGSHCGFAWPKFWKPNCGQPVTGAACTGSH